MTRENAPVIRVDVQKQVLELVENGEASRQFSISTAANGLGEEENSGCTPRGIHYITAKFGDDAPTGAVFVAREATGEVYSEDLAAAHPDRDWILSRILWLSGAEVGLNRLGHVDSMRRYIYIHGTPDSEPMGEPRSHGCIRMRNADVIALYEQVSVGTEVHIQESFSQA